MIFGTIYPGINDLNVFYYFIATFYVVVRKVSTLFFFIVKYYLNLVDVPFVAAGLNKGGDTDKALCQVVYIRLRLPQLSLRDYIIKCTFECAESAPIVWGYLFMLLLLLSCVQQEQQTHQQCRR